MITQTKLQTQEELWHLPDYQFVTHCFEVYGLNRGIYNTMDEWLYRFGFQEIVRRRQTMIAFLSSPHVPERGSGRYLKFGKGGLTKQLYDFVRSS